MLAKKLCCLLVAFLCVANFSIAAYANDLDTFGIPVVDIDEYQLAVDVMSELSISGTTATCVSEVIGITGVTYISVTQTLQKKQGLSFNNVSGASWSTSTFFGNLLFENTKSDLLSGTYRVKSVFTIKKGSTTETITSYSNEATV